MLFSIKRWNYASFPMIGRQPRIVPSKKKGNKDDAINYCPISLTNILFTLLKSILKQNYYDVLRI